MPCLFSVGGPLAQGSGVVYKSSQVGTLNGVSKGVQKHILGKDLDTAIYQMTFYNRLPPAKSRFHTD